MYSRVMLRFSSTSAASPVSRSRGALIALCLAFFVVLFDGSALNLALPSIAEDIGGSIASLQWVVTAYTIPLAALLLTAGHVGDRFGRSRLFVWSLVAFALLSLACGLAPGIGWLVAARIVQGVAGAGVMPMILALIGAEFPDKAARARAINTLAAVGASAAVLGPFVGGVLAQLLDWRLIFFVNVPLAAATAVLARRHLQVSAMGESKPLDVRGQLLAVGALTVLVAGLITLGQGSALVAIAMVTAGAFLAVAFVLVERGAAHPLLPVAVFRNRVFRTGVLGGFAFQFGAYGLPFMLALFLVRDWGATPIIAAVILLPFSLAMIGTTLFLNPFLLRNGRDWMMTAGTAIAAAGAVVAAFSNQSTTLPVLAVGLVMMGAGNGIYSPTLNELATTSIAPELAGLGSGIYNTSRQVGMAFGVGLLGTLIAGRDPVLGLRLGLVLMGAGYLGLLVLARLTASRPTEVTSRSPR